MSCLHLISKRLNADELELLTRLVGEDDAFLLIGDGLQLQPALTPLPQPLYCWQTEADAEQALALTLSHDKSMSWHD